MFLPFCSCVVCFSFVTFNFFNMKMRMARKNVSKWPILHQVGCKILTPSIIELMLWYTVQCILLQASLTRAHFGLQLMPALSTSISWLYRRLTSVKRTLCSAFSVCAFRFLNRHFEWPSPLFNGRFPCEPGLADPPNYLPAVVSEENFWE